MDSWDRRVRKTCAQYYLREVAEMRLFLVFIIIIGSGKFKLVSKF